MFCYTRQGRSEVRGNIVFLGDSITDDGRFVSFVNTYLRLYLPDAPVNLRNLGVSSETVSGLSEPDHPFPRPCLFGRLERVLKATQPDWAVIFYGVNDGIYYPFNEDYFAKFRQGYRRLMDTVHAAGAKAVALTPPPFDSASFLAQGRKLAGADQDKYSFAEPYEKYNEVMERYARWIVDELSEHTELVIDLYAALRDDRASLRQTNPSLTVGDGIHPDLHGHWTIAKTLLKNLFGFDVENFENVMRTDQFSLFDRIYARDTLLHCHDKESVGHDNEYKTEYLCGEDLEKAVRGADANIARYIAGHDALLRQTSRWNGFEMDLFHFEGCEACVVKPSVPAQGFPWIWRAEFFGAFASVDLEMVRGGWHLAYLRIPDQFGCPAATAQMERFQVFVQNVYHMREKAVLFGFSRGGLYALHYAARVPERVASLYLDAPVADICSWPGGKGISGGSPLDWRLCLCAFGLTEQSADAYRPLLTAALHTAASAGIPLILVAGDSDQTVPYTENGALAESAWKDSGTPFRLILKPGVGHHPHSMEDPSAIVSFLLEN